MRPPVSWAPARYRLCRCNDKAGACKMHANLPDLTVTASDHDLMDVRGDQFTNDRVASSIVRRDGNGLAKCPTDGIRRNLLVPLPRAVSLLALNEQLLEGCRRLLGDRLRGHDETIGERLVRDLEALHSLPPTPYDACEKRTGRVSSQLLVRYRGTDYSVPTAYGHRDVVIRGYVHEVVISCGAEVIARHPRSYERDDFVFNRCITWLCSNRRSVLSTRPRRWSAGTCPRNLPRGVV